MMQILPAAPAPGPGPAATTAATTTATTGDTSGGESELVDEFMAMLADALTAMVAGDVATDPPDETDMEAAPAAVASEETALATLDLASIDQLSGAAPAVSGDSAVADPDAAPALGEGDDAPLSPGVGAPPQVAVETTPQTTTGIDDETALATVTPVDDEAVAEDVGEPGIEAGDETREAGDLAGDAADLAGDAADVAPAPDVAPTGPVSAAVPGEFAIPEWIMAQYRAEQAELSANARTAPPAESTAATTSPASIPTTPTIAVTPPPEVAPAAPTSPIADPSMVDGDDPWQQLATVIRPLRQMSDGSHRLSLQLRPAELGTVHLEVAVEDGQLSVRAVAENIATRDILASALPELRAELSRSGIDVGSLDVGEHTTDGSSSDQGPSLDAPPAANHTSTAGTPIDPATSTSSSSNTSSSINVTLPGRLDLSL